MSTDELFKAVVKWGREHYIDNPDKQILKSYEELAEVTREIVRGRYNTPDVIDGIGDTMVTLIILADILGFNPKDCLQEAYDTIKDRKGKSVSGCFVKEEDISD